MKLAGILSPTVARDRAHTGMGERESRDSAEVHHTFTLSADGCSITSTWFGTGNRSARSLPQKYYGRLPLIARGPKARWPRVYHAAGRIVAQSGGALEPEIIQKFLIAFQAVAPLDIAELSALPLMLHGITRLSALSRSRSSNSKAERRGGLLGESARHRRTPQFAPVPQDDGRTGGTYPEPTPHFGSELMAHLYDEESGSRW